MVSSALITDRNIYAFHEWTRALTLLLSHVSLKVSFRHGI